MRNVHVTIFNQIHKVHEVLPIFDGVVEIPAHTAVDEVTRKIAEKWMDENNALRGGTICFDNYFGDDGKVNRQIVRFNYQKKIG